MQFLTGIGAMCVATAMQGAVIASFIDFDKDGNGVITEQEFHSTQQEHRRIQSEAGLTSSVLKQNISFLDIDQNNDSFISPEELRAFKRRLYSQNIAR